MPDNSAPAPKKSPTKSSGDAPKREGDRPNRVFPQSAWLLALLALGLGFFAMQSMTQIAEIDYRFFWEQLQDKNVTKAVIQGQTLFGEFKDPPLPPGT